MKTLQPLILTARISDSDLKPFELLRQEHFPPDRNFLSAHLTMFHRLPGEYRAQVVEHLVEVAAGYTEITADISGLLHLGAGVAFTVASPELQAIHAQLRGAFMPWLGGQDMQKWQPHITIQNKVSKLAADTLHASLTKEFRPHTIEIIGLDLWRYLGGPWQHETSAMFGPGRHRLQRWFYSGLAADSRKGEMMELEDRQWKARAVAAELVAQAIEVLMSAGFDEHSAFSALEDALETRRTAYNMPDAGD